MRRILYKVLKRFGPESGPRWEEYKAAFGLEHLECFQSVDAILRPDLFLPETAADWKHCVNEDFKLSLITDLEYAKRVLGEHPGAELVGVEIELGPDHVPEPGLLGYDILDAWCEVSMVTNYGYETWPFDKSIIMANGLIGDLEVALDARDKVRSSVHDDHGRNCQVWAVYRVDSV